MQIRYYQDDATCAVLNYLDNNVTGNPIVAMPTGTGKSVVIAEIVRRVLMRWPMIRFIMSTHVKELIAQNADKLHTMLPGVDLGIYSAGLKQKTALSPVVYGGVASMVKNPKLFGVRHLMLVDECHLISDTNEAMYLTLIDQLKIMNPKMRVVGFTATPYRMGLGMLTNGRMFDHICYDDTTLERFNRLIAEGFLAMLIPQQTDVYIDKEGVLTSSTGDYVQSQAEDRAMQVTRAALTEAVNKYKHTRFSWLIFAGGLKHCYQIRDILTEQGVSCTVIHSNSKEYPITEKERDERIADFKAGKYQAVINYGVLTTGFDHPPIDLIIMLRLTKSVPLWVQMLGRGTRPFEGDSIFPPKKNCLVLDYARNTRLLGPINDPVIPGKKGVGAGDAPVKICECCGTYNHISVRWCVGCGEEFQFAVKIHKQADDAELIRDLEPVYERFYVTQVYYSRHKPSKYSKSGLDTLKVSYFVSGQVLPYNEYVCIEHMGHARNSAVNWWSQRSATPCPATIEEALQQLSALREPKMLTVWTNATPFPSIVRCDYE
jgi:DNA repair protein RadD